LEIFQSSVSAASREASLLRSFCRSNDPLNNPTISINLNTQTRNVHTCQGSGLLTDIWSVWIHRLAVANRGTAHLFARC